MTSIPCDWHPDTGSRALSGDPPHADAELILGPDRLWRLCRACAELPFFDRITTREEIKSG